MAGDGATDPTLGGGPSRPTSVQIRRPRPPAVEAKFGGPLWRAVVRFWLGALILSLAIWAEATLGNGGGLGNGSEPHAWLVPVATFVGGLLALLIALATGFVVTDRRVLYSAWMTLPGVAGLFLFQLGFTGEPLTDYSLAVGAVMFPCYLVTVAVLARMAASR
jgi:hypothetical protein